MWHVFAHDESKQDITFTEAGLNSCQPCLDPLPLQPYEIRHKSKQYPRDQNPNPKLWTLKPSDPKRPSIVFF